MPTILQSTEAGPALLNYEGGVYEFKRPKGTLTMFAPGRKVSGTGPDGIIRHWSETLTPAGSETTVEVKKLSVKVVKEAALKEPAPKKVKEKKPAAKKEPKVKVVEKLKDLKLAKADREALERFRNGYGTLLWKEELKRFFRGEENALDGLYVNDPAALFALKDIVGPHLLTLDIPYTGPDRD